MGTNASSVALLTVPIQSFEGFIAATFYVNASDAANYAISFVAVSSSNTEYAWGFGIQPIQGTGWLSILDFV